MVARRRVMAVIALALAGAVVPAGAETETVCGALVCARAEANARWECGPQSEGSSIFVCEAGSSAGGFGSSDVAPPSGAGIPASAWWRTIRWCDVITPSGIEDCGAENDGPNLCTWDGVGENRCGGVSFGDHGPFLFSLTPGRCIHDVLAEGEYDIRITAGGWAWATRSLPAAGTVDAAEADVTERAFLSSIPRDETTCAPE